MRMFRLFMMQISPFHLLASMRGPCCLLPRRSIGCINGTTERLPKAGSKMDHHLSFRAGWMNLGLLLAGARRFCRIKAKQASAGGKNELSPLWRRRVNPWVDGKARPRSAAKAVQSFVVAAGKLRIGR